MIFAANEDSGEYTAVKIKKGDIFLLHTFVDFLGNLSIFHSLQTPEALDMLTNSI